MFLRVSTTQAFAAAVLLSQLSVPGLCASPTQSPPVPSLGVSSTWSGDTSYHATADNSGRQLAVAFPVIPHTMNVRVPSPLNSRIINKSSSYKKDQVIKITVPASVDEAADVCTVGFKRFSVVGQDKAKELCRWALAFHKQMTQTPMMTPLGGPYSTPSIAQTKLWYMPDGRLKTVVKR
jgi:hypothetical protein